MQYSKGKIAVESDHDSTAQSANTRYCPPWEIDAFRHHALGRMMVGLCLSLLGVVLGLVSPTVAAQTDYAAPDVVQLGAIGVVAMTLVLVLLALLRKNGQRATNRQHNGHNLSVHERSSASTAGGFKPLSDPEILRQVAEQFDRCRNQQDYLGVLRIGLDHDAEPESGYAAAALRETVASIAKSRGGLLLPAENGDFVVTLCGDLPDQTQEISDDFREAVSDLALSGTNGLITVSVGLFIARPEGECRAEHYLERASEMLEQARHRGGNRVESETV